MEMLPLALGVLKIDGEDSGKTKMSKYMYIPVETYLKAGVTFLNFPW